MTIAHIAETAGVSVPTVSKVLNGRSGVSDQTRARIEELIEQYGYRKPPAKGNDILELVFHELAGMRAVDVIRGVEQVARKHRFGVVISESGPGAAAGSAVDELVERRPRAVLAVAQLSEDERSLLKTRGIPFLVLDPATELPDDVPFVGATDWRGGQTATRHLIKLGHRHIAVISDPHHLPCRARLAGFHSAMQAAGLPVEPELIADAPLTREDGHAAALSLLTRADRPTAIFAANDLQALGVYRAARELGLRIPEDLSVVGFDDLPVGAWVEPPLTTVHRPLAEMASAAAELALSLGRGEEPAQIGVEMATTLTVRESTAAPATAS
ncbi:LacI family DNA-binding transcriptional regulator [Catenulispora acidiphila]|uniref:LacI family DNA-binding transcriptional regulator n=1 Tax=Catenulispora acidiphila TaxID=304895 RepID=UPI0002DFD114|nr:LacI family DNA-binding transcriptional regulator [Catenulispora acidiphila]